MNKRRELGITVNQTPSFLRLREEFVRKIRTKYDSAFVKLELLSLRTKTGRSPVESSRSLISSLRIGGSGATSPNSTHVSDQQCCVCRRTLRFLDARYACQVCEKVACGQHATQFPSLPPSTAKVDCCRRCHCYLRRYFLLKKLKSRIGGSHRLPVVRVYQKLLEGTSRISASMPGFKGLVLSLVYLFDAFSIDAERPTDEQGAPIFLPQSTIYELVRKAAEAQLELSSRCSELQVDLKALFEIAKNASPTLARLVGSLRLTVMSFLSSNSVEFHNLTSQFLRVQYFFINQGMLDANVVHKVADEQRKASPSPPDQQPKPVPDEQTKKNLSPHLNPEDLFEHHNTALKDIPIGDGPPKIQPNSLSNANLDPFRHWPNSHSAPSPSLLDSFSNRLSRLFQERPSNDLEPTIHYISTVSFPLCGGVSILIEGSHFCPDTRLFLNDTPIPKKKTLLIDDSHLEFVTPTMTHEGPVSLTLENPNQKKTTLTNVLYCSNDKTLLDSFFETRSDSSIFDYWTGEQ